MKKSLGKSPLGHDFRYVLGKNLWIFLLGLGIFLLLIPFSTAGLPGSSILNVEVTHNQMKFRLFHPSAAPAILAAALGLGLVTGIALFRFVLDKKETTIFFSLGITRSQLFCSRLAAGVLILALSLVLPMGLSCWLNFRALGGYEGLVRNMIYLTFGLFLVEMVSFFLALLGIFLAGTLPEACIYWAGLLALPTVLCYGGNMLLKQLFWGNAWGVLDYSGASALRPSLVSLGAWWNPILFLLEKLETHGQFVRPLSTAIPENVDWTLLLGWTAVAALLGILSWWLLRRRRAELSGTAAVNPVLSECVLLGSGFITFAGVFSLLFPYDGRLAAALGCLGLLGVHLFWRKTLFSVSRRRVLRSLGLQGGLLAAACVICAAGLSAGTMHFLQNGEIVQASVTYVGAPQWLSGSAAGSSTGRGYYIFSELQLDTPEAIDAVTQLQMEFISTGCRDLGSGDTVSDTVVPYDICFSYVDTTGQEHVWYYDRSSYAQLEQLLELENLEAVKQQQISVFQQSEDGETSLAAAAYATGQVYLTSPYLTDTYQLSLDQDQRQQLLSALEQDLLDMTMEQRYFPDSASQAVLLFTDVGEQDCQYFTYHLDNEYLYLTAAYENTLAWLTENGLLALVSAAPEVEYIVLQRFDPYIGINGLEYPMGMYFMAYCGDTSSEFLVQKDFGKQYTFTDPTEVQTLLGGLQPGYYMTRGGYLAAVKLSGESRLRYLFLPEGNIPDFVAG